MSSTKLLYVCLKSVWKARVWGVFVLLMDVYGSLNEHLRGYIRGVSATHDEVLLFRQKDPKPGAPGRSHARRRPGMARV